MRYEKQDAPAGLIALFGVLFVILAFISLAGLRNYFEKLRSKDTSAISERAPAPFIGLNERGLQTQPEEELATYKTEQNQKLRSYAWVDRPHGLARIPIERAMRILSEGRR